MGDVKPLKFISTNGAIQTSPGQRPGNSGNPKVALKVRLKP